jgi:hypothetical protein
VRARGTVAQTRSESLPLRLTWPEVDEGADEKRTSSAFNNKRLADQATAPGADEDFEWDPSCARLLALLASLWLVTAAPPMDRHDMGQLRVVVPPQQQPGVEPTAAARWAPPGPVAWRAPASAAPDLIRCCHRPQGPVGYHSSSEDESMSISVPVYRSKPRLVVPRHWLECNDV